MKELRKKVLVVDDDASILDALTLILEESGYEVFAVSDAKDITQIISSFRPDVILLDILMSGQDGRDICKIIKHNGLANEIPVIMISAHPGAEKSALACGANAFISKPFELNDLIKAIEMYTGGTSPPA